MQGQTRNRVAVNGEADFNRRVLHPKPEAAWLLGISLRTLDYMICRGEIKTVKLKKRRLVPRSQIEKIARGAR
jgi:excisionase family DNA binding protein